MTVGIARRATVISSGRPVVQMNLTQVAADNFNRANGSIAGANNWLATTEGTLSISSNEILGVLGTTQGNYRTSETYSSNQYSQCVVGSVPLVTTGGAASIGVSVRNQDNQNNYEIIYLYSGGYLLNMYKKVAGSYIALGSITLGAALAQGTTVTLIIEGSVIQALVGGNPVMAIIDTTFASGGTPGVTALNANTLDNWSGGNAATVSVGSALLTDNFNRSNGNLSVGNPNWVLMNYPYSGAATVECAIVSNQVSTQNPPVTAHAGNIRTDAVLTNDQWSAIQMGTSAMNSTGFVGMTTRNQGSGATLGNSCYLGCNFQAGTGGVQAYRIYRLDTGTSTLLASTQQSTAGNDPAGTEYRIVSQGSRHSLQVNGSEILHAVDATYALGPPGIQMFGNSTADNWSGGNV